MCVSVNVLIHIPMSISISLSVSKFIYSWICMHACMHTRTHTHTHAHTHTIMCKTLFSSRASGNLMSLYVYRAVAEPATEIDRRWRLGA